MTPTTNPRTSDTPGDSGVTGVFHSESDARAVADGVVALGIEPSRVIVGERDDQYRAIRSEMQEEIEQSWISPQAGVAYPKESAKGLVAVTPIAAVLGIVILLPFAAVPMGDLELGWRLLIMAVVGAAMGFAVGLIIGPAISVRRSNEGLAAERGVVVRVSPANEAVERLMADHNPIRVDRFVGEELEVVQTEELSQGSGMVEEVKRNLTNPKMENDPGYEPAERSDRSAGSNPDSARRRS